MRLFHHADGPLAAVCAGAIETWVGVRDVPANRALANFFFGIANRIRQRQRIFRRQPQQMKTRDAEPSFVQFQAGVLVRRSVVQQSGESRHAFVSTPCTTAQSQLNLSSPLSAK